MSLRLGFDIDGVLADFRAAFRASAIRIVRGDVEDFDPGESPQGASPLSPEDVRRVWDHIAKAENWWMEIDAYEPDQIARLYSLARAAGGEDFLFTNRPPAASDPPQIQPQWRIQRDRVY